MIDSGAGTLTLSGAIGGTALTKGGAGKLVLSSAASTYTGATTNAAGTLSISSESNIGNSSANLQLASGTTLETTAGFTLNAGRSVLLAGAATISPTAGELIIGQAITTGTTLTKTGAGTLTLGGANTYSGLTTVSAGTLKVSGSIANGVTVSAAGTLKGTGTIAGTTTVSGTEAPGASVGTLNTGNQDFAPGGVFEMEIDDATGTSGVSPGWDKAAVTGCCRFQRLLQLPSRSSSCPSTGVQPGDIANFAAGGTHSWTIVSTTAGITGFDSTAFIVDSSSFSNALGAVGAFRVVVVNAGLDLAVEYYQQDPYVTSQPANTTNCVGNNATFTVVAAGSPNILYQWRKNGANLVDDAKYSGTTSDTLTVSSLVTGDAGTYSVKVIGDTTLQTNLSANATLTVAPAVTFSSNPASRTNSAGDFAFFSSAATAGTTPITYQWQLNGVGISGTTTTSLVRSNINTADAGDYALVANNGFCSSATSSVATLTIIGLNKTQIALWNFNSTVPDTNVNTGVITPAVGSGTIATNGNPGSPIQRL